MLFLAGDIKGDIGNDAFAAKRCAGAVRADDGVFGVWGTAGNDSCRKGQTTGLILLILRGIDIRAARTGGDTRSGRV